MEIEPAWPPASRRRALPAMQELGLLVVILLMGSVLGVFGHRNAGPDHRNTFLNPDNLIENVATPMSYYAIMAVGATFVIISGGIDISVGSMMAVSSAGARLMRPAPGCSRARCSGSVSPAVRASGCCGWRARSPTSRVPPR